MTFPLFRTLTVVVDVSVAPTGAISAGLPGSDASVKCGMRPALRNVQWSSPIVLTPMALALRDFLPATFNALLHLCENATSVITKVVGVSSEEPIDVKSVRRTCPTSSWSADIACCMLASAANSTGSDKSARGTASRDVFGANSECTLSCFVTSLVTSLKKTHLTNLSVTQHCSADTMQVWKAHRSVINTTVQILLV